MASSEPRSGGEGEPSSVAWLRGAADDGFDPGYDGPTTIVLLRHGRTVLNAEHRLQGRLNPPLDEVGIEQAESVGALIRERWKVDRVVTSPSLRARQTLEHGGFADVPTTVDERFAEIDYGMAEGWPVEEAISSLAWGWTRDVHYEPPGGGESLASLSERVRAACDDLLASPSGEVVLVATHATPVKAAVVWALGGDASMILRLHVSQASLSAIGQTPIGLVVFTYNEQP
jgi:broad specificity phosphatase PhoE